jgi:hypothetical protein
MIFSTAVRLLSRRSATYTAAATATATSHPVSIRPPGSSPKASAPILDEGERRHGGEPARKFAPQHRAQ